LNQNDAQKHEALSDHAIYNAQKEINFLAYLDELDLVHLFYISFAINSKENLSSIQ